MNQRLARDAHGARRRDPRGLSVQAAADAHGRLQCRNEPAAFRGGAVLLVACHSRTIHCTATPLRFDCFDSLLRFLACHRTASQPARLRGEDEKTFATEQATARRHAHHAARRPQRLSMQHQVLPAVPHSTAPPLRAPQWACGSNRQVGCACVRAHTAGRTRHWRPCVQHRPHLLAPAPLRPRAPPSRPKLRPRC